MYVRVCVRENKRRSKEREREREREIREWQGEQFMEELFALLNRI